MHGSTPFGRRVRMMCYSSHAQRAWLSTDRVLAVSLCRKALAQYEKMANDTEWTSAETNYMLTMHAEDARCLLEKMLTTNDLMTRAKAAFEAGDMDEVNRLMAKVDTESGRIQDLSDENHNRIKAGADLSHVTTADLEVRVRVRVGVMGED